MSPALVCSTSSSGSGSQDRPKAARQHSAALNGRPQLICNILRGEARLNTEVRVEHLHVIHEDVHAQIGALIEIGQLRLRRDRNPRLGDLLCDAALIDRNSQSPLKALHYPSVQPDGDVICMAVTSGSPVPSGAPVVTVTISPDKPSGSPSDPSASRYPPPGSAPHLDSVSPASSVCDKFTSACTRKTRQCQLKRILLGKLTLVR